MVIVWSTSADSTAELVERALTPFDVRVLRVDTDKYGNGYELSWQLHQGLLRLSSGASVPLADVSAIYYRRPSIGEVPRDERDFALHESWYFTRSLLMQATSTTRWMNHPARVFEAENKLRQLEIAKDVGFPVPECILTSSDEEAFEFYQRTGRNCVCKPGFAGLISRPRKSLAVYAWRLPKDLSFGDFSSVQESPTFLQEAVDKVADIRATYVGGRVFPARIRSKSFDWRSEIGGQISYECASVADDVLKRMNRLMERLGLSYGAFDFAESRDGEWNFLEMNPAGQFEWIEYELGLPISRGIAEWLAS